MTDKYILVEDKSYTECDGLYGDKVVESHHVHYFKNDDDLLAFVENKTRYMKVKGIYVITPVTINTTLTINK